MFQFGLFSTFIPYLIFGISYIGFLGLNALENDKGFDFTNTTSRYELKSQNPVNSDVHKHIKFYHACEIKADRALLIDQRYETNIYFLSNDDIIKENYHSCHFSRPPPRIS